MKVPLQEILQGVAMKITLGLIYLSLILILILHHARENIIQQSSMDTSAYGEDT